MKKFLALALALVMALSLVACSKPAEPAPAPEADPAPAEPKLTTVTEGKLTVATSPDFAPYEFYVVPESGEPQLAGFDMALAQYIADYLGLELEVVPMDFDGVLMELANKSVDLGMAGLSPDPEREGAMDFSDIYYEGGQSFWTSKANADKWSDLASLNNPELSVAAQIASIQEGLAKENSADAEYIPLVKVTDIIAELLSGKVDGAYIETAVGETYAKNYPDLVKVCDVPYDEAGSSVGVSKGNAELLAGVNEAIAAALADGSMNQFVATANEQAGGNIHEGLLETLEG